MSQLPELATTFAAGAAGCLTMWKLIQKMTAKTADTNNKRVSALFPNGEKREILDIVDALLQSDRDKHKEILALRSEVTGEVQSVRADVARIAKALGIPL